MGLLQTAAAALVGAERRTEIAARNIANAQTPGYKREIAYSEIAASARVADEQLAAPTTNSVLQLAAGALTDAGGPLDLAIRGPGHVLVRSGDQFFLSRGGQFRRDPTGALVDGAGRALQQAGGGDLILGDDAPEILADGTVLTAGAPVGAIGLYAATPGEVADARTGLGPDRVLALSESTDSELRQGMLERSNVVLSDEMTGLIRNQRFAEGGAQLVRAYDQLLGQAVATFGKRG